MQEASSSVKLCPREEEKEKSKITVKQMNISHSALAMKNIIVPTGQKNPNQF